MRVNVVQSSVKEDIRTVIEPPGPNKTVPERMGGGGINQTHNMRGGWLTGQQKPEASETSLAVVVMARLAETDTEIIEKTSLNH